MSRGLAYSDTVTVTTECSACGGTGLYQGFAQEAGYPTVCSNCKGSGGKEVTYTPFTGRRLKDGVRGVRPVNPTWRNKPANAYPTISYDEFRREYPEAKVRD